MKPQMLYTCITELWSHQYVQVASVDYHYNSSGQPTNVEEVAKNSYIVPCVSRGSDPEAVLQRVNNVLRNGGATVREASR